MPEINLVDKSLQNYHNKTEISIQVSLSGFSFCIYTPENYIIRAFRYYKFKHAIILEDILNGMDDVLAKDELLRLPQKKARVIYTGRKSTMVPYEFFSAEQLKQLLEFNHPLEDLEEIHYNDMHFIDSYLAFAMPTYAAGMIAERIKEADFYNQAAPLLFFAGELIKNQEGDGVIINLNKDFFDILVVQNNALKFINTFLYVNSIDLLYFILYVCKQLKVDAKKITFHFTGEESNRTDLTTELSDYIPNLKKINTLHGMELGKSLGKLDTSRHFTLLHLAKCE